MLQLPGRPGQLPAEQPGALSLLLDLPLTPPTVASTAATAAVAATAPAALAAAATALAAPFASTSVLAAATSAQPTAAATAATTLASAGAADRNRGDKWHGVLNKDRRGRGELGRMRRGGTRPGARVPELLRRHGWCGVQRRRRLLRCVHCGGPAHRPCLGYRRLRGVCGSELSARRAAAAAATRAAARAAAAAPASAAALVSAAAAAATPAATAAATAAPAAGVAAASLRA